MKRAAPPICTCPTCQQLDRAFPDEGRQIAMFSAPETRKSSTRDQPKGAH